MRSIRTKTILLNLISVTAALIITAVIGTVYVGKIGHANSEQTLSLLCQNAKSNLNNYFKSVEQSVNTISSLVDANLDALDEATFDTSFHNHIDKLD